MVQCYTLLNFSILLSYFAADLLWNFGFLGIHAANNNISCQACPTGTFANNSVPECNNCSRKGWCNSTSFCVKCPVGHYQNVTGKTECVPCPVGHYQDLTGKTECLRCPVGHYQNVTGKKVCLPCPVGHYQDKPGNYSCSPCRKGFYSKSAGSPRCISCKFGEYCNTLGCTSCSSCPAGTQADRMGAQNCTRCPRGFYKASKSSHVCEKCANGYFQDTTGQTFCKKCPERYFCPWPDEPPVPCGPKELCPAGSKEPLEECKGLHKRNNETEECELSSIVYIIIGVVLSVIVAGVVFVAVRRYRQNNEQKQRLLERQHPVYTGW